MSSIKKKGVILFLVEGISDKIALSLPMTCLLNRSYVQFQIMHGDCLNRTDGRTIQIIQSSIRDVMVKYSYRKSDFTRIIHIIDTDGSFIPDRCVYLSKNSGVEYFSDHIETGELHETIARHHRRTAMAEKLAHTEKILGIPYDIYFMSRNLEHVTQNNGGKVSSSHKVTYAEKFADRFADDIFAFTDLLYKAGVAAEGDYLSSWHDIMTGTNSLRRRTNINFLIEQYFDDVYSVR